MSARAQLTRTLDSDRQVTADQDARDQSQITHILLLNPRKSGSVELASCKAQHQFRMLAWAVKVSKLRAASSDQSLITSFIMLSPIGMEGFSAPRRRKSDICHVSARSTFPKYLESTASEWLAAFLPVCRQRGGSHRPGKVHLACRPAAPRRQPRLPPRAFHVHLYDLDL